MPASSSGAFPSSTASMPKSLTAEDYDLRRLLLSSFPTRPSSSPAVTSTRPPLTAGSSAPLQASSSPTVAVHDKIISAAGRDLRIGGINVVCVAPAFRGRGLVRRMLLEAHAWMQRESIPFGMLFGNPKVYAWSGYLPIENPILANNSLLQFLNPFKGKPMIHQIAATPWPAGPVDLRGPTF